MIHESDIPDFVSSETILLINSTEWVPRALLWRIVEAIPDISLLMTEMGSTLLSCR